MWLWLPWPKHVSTNENRLQPKIVTQSWNEDEEKNGVETNEYELRSQTDCIYHGCSAWYEPDEFWLNLVRDSRGKHKRKRTDKTKQEKNL